MNFATAAGAACAQSAESEVGSERAPQARGMKPAKVWKEIFGEFMIDDKGEEKEVESADGGIELVQEKLEFKA